MKREREQFLNYLRDRGHRVTRERLRLFEAIYAHHGHLDAESLLHSMQEGGLKISRATVYRNLELLVEAGLVRKQRLGRNRFLYEHVHPGQRHDHLVCRLCGRVAEFVSTGIAALQIEICRAHGFVAQEHTLQITSICSECADAKADENEDPANQGDRETKSGALGTDAKARMEAGASSSAARSTPTVPSPPLPRMPELFGH